MCYDDEFSLTITASDELLVVTPVPSDNYVRPSGWRLVKSKVYLLEKLLLLKLQNYERYDWSY